MILVTATATELGYYFLSGSGTKSMEKWSLLHDTKGARYGIMGIDIADLNNNHMLRGIKCLPLAGMVEMTYKRMVKYFNNKSAAAINAMGNPSMNFPERVQDDLNAKMQKAQMHQVICMNTKDSDSSFGEADKIFKVQLRQKHVIVHLKSIYTRSMNKTHKCTICKIAICSCNKPQLHHKPCSHVIAVFCQIGVCTATYMFPYYSMSYLVGTWNGTFDESEIFKNYRCYKDLVLWETTTWIPDKKTGMQSSCLPNNRLHANWHR
uniref:SWIM-type domain-containing protein n=1 Tax=Arundo donax TaxID=35708 RepID=A0A0A9E3K0_ARUDO